MYIDSSKDTFKFVQSTIGWWHFL